MSISFVKRPRRKISINNNNKYIYNRLDFLQEKMIWIAGFFMPGLNTIFH